MPGRPLWLHVNQRCFWQYFSVAWVLPELRDRAGFCFYAIYTIQLKQLTERKYDVTTINLYVFMLTAAACCPLRIFPWLQILSVLLLWRYGPEFYFSWRRHWSSIANWHLYTASIRYIDSSKAAIAPVVQSQFLLWYWNLYLQWVSDFFIILGMIVLSSALVLLANLAVAMFVRCTSAAMKGLSFSVSFWQRTGMLQYLVLMPKIPINAKCAHGDNLLYYSVYLKLR